MKKSLVAALSKRDGVMIANGVAIHLLMILVQEKNVRQLSIAEHRDMICITSDIQISDLSLFTHVKPPISSGDVFYIHEHISYFLIV